jgi:L-threonylcarbamoyladenylate synthase
VKPEIITLAGGEPDGRAIARAARCLDEGGLVAFPTDTVYGIGASPARPDAIDRIYTAKRRDRAKPLARLVHDAQAAARAAGTWTRLAAKLARVYWPGALTIVVGGIGTRVPAHQSARGLSGNFPEGLATTSANRAGSPEARTASEVVDALGDAVDLVLDGGQSAGTPSTVVRAEGERPEILRSGAIDEQELRLVAPPTVLFVCRGNTCRSPMAAAFFIEELQRRNRTDVAVVSAGIDVGGDTSGAGASEGAHRAAAASYIDLSGHEVTPLTPAMLARADWVFVMEQDQADRIASLLPEERSHLRLLDPDGTDIGDPYGQGEDEYARARDAIREAVRTQADVVLGPPDGSTEDAAA